MLTRSVRLPREEEDGRYQADHEPWVGDEEQPEGDFQAPARGGMGEPRAVAGDDIALANIASGGLRARVELPAM
jgi:hypothetical protein